jgi:hypothetical protein
MGRVREIDAGELLLRPVGREVAAALLEGRVPAGVVLAPGYPSQFSLGTMRLVVDADGDGDGYHRASATAQVGDTVVEPSWGRGYATAALRALLAHLLADRRVRRVVAETLEAHTASRRVMEKAGMRYHHARVGEVDGEPVALVVYEARPGDGEG